MNREIKRSTRRQIMVGAAMMAAGTVLRPAQASPEADAVSHRAESIHQENVFAASRKRVYEALTDTRQFDKVIQLGGMNTMSPGSEPTAISRELGGSFILFGGHIIGRQLELVPNERIVQGWRVVDWPAGIYSIARFDLVEQGSATRVVFDHTGFPQGLGKHLADGWNSHYWGPLEKLFAAETK